MGLEARVSLFQHWTRKTLPRNSLQFADRGAFSGELHSFVEMLLPYMQTRVVQERSLPLFSLSVTLRTDV
jgi:hypothetical protein